MLEGIFCGTQLPTAQGVGKTVWQFWHGGDIWVVNWQFWLLHGKLIVCCAQLAVGQGMIGFVWQFWHGAIPETF